MNASPFDRTTGGPETLAAPHLFATLRARWRTVLIGLLAGLAVGGLLSLTMTTEYHAVATVKVGAGLVSGGDVSDQTLGSDTEAQIAVLPPQLRTLATELGVSERSVKKQLSVAARTGTPLVDFTYTASSGSAAEKGADAASAVYLAEAARSAQARVLARLQFLRRQFKATVWPARRNDLRNDIRTLRVTVIDHGQVVSGAAGSAARSVLRPSTYLGLGAVAGLLLGAMVAMLVEAARPRVRRRVAVPGVPLLGHVGARAAAADMHAALLPMVVRVGADRLGLFALGRRDEALKSLAEQAAAGARVLDVGDESDLETARRLEGVVLVVREGTPLTAIRSLTTTLDMVGAEVLGLVTAAPGVRPEGTTADEGSVAESSESEQAAAEPAAADVPAETDEAGEVERKDAEPEAGDTDGTDHTDDTEAGEATAHERRLSLLRGDGEDDEKDAATGR